METITRKAYILYKKKHFVYYNAACSYTIKRYGSAH